RDTRAPPPSPTRRSSDLRAGAVLARLPWPVRRSARHDHDGAVGVLEQGVRDAPERGDEAAEPARADDDLVRIALPRQRREALGGDRKSTRLNSSHVKISY